jgi:hypothetical protein
MGKKTAWSRTAHRFSHPSHHRPAFVSSSSRLPSDICSKTENTTVSEFNEGLPRAKVGLRLMLPSAAVLCSTACLGEELR